MVLQNVIFIEVQQELNQSSQMNQQKDIAIEGHMQELEQMNSLREQLTSLSAQNESDKATIVSLQEELDKATSHIQVRSVSTSFRAKAY